MLYYNNNNITTINYTKRKEKTAKVALYIKIHM